MKITELFKYPASIRAEQLAFFVYRLFAWPRDGRAKRNPTWLSAYEKRIYSQHAEDGILVELANRLRIGRGGTFVEFGAAAGDECNCAALARIYDWGGLMIEADPELFTRLRSTYRTFPKVQLRQSFVTVENIASILTSANIDVGFDLLSIDIDGNDYWLWQALSSFRAKIVVIEFNAFFKPPKRFVKAYDPSFVWAMDWNYGASLSAMEELGRAQGYALLGVDSSATNAFFVRDDLAEQTGFPRLTAAEAMAQARPFWQFSRRTTTISES
jgi:hypothetical protein